MARRRRESEIFSMSFLDCICCGFGAVILVFMIINAQVKGSREAEPDRMSETRKLEVEILEGRKNMVLARNTIEELETRNQDAQGEIDRILALIAELREELSKYDDETLAKIERVEKLQSDIKSLEEEVERLLKMAREDPAAGDRIRSFDDEGQGPPVPDRPQGRRQAHPVPRRPLRQHARGHDRQRGPAPPPARRGRCARAKWRQAVRTVDWLTTQIPPGTEFQIYVFNTTARARHRRARAAPGSRPKDGTSLDQAVATLRGRRPRAAPAWKRPSPPPRQLEPAARQHHPAHRRPAHAGTSPPPRTADLAASGVGLLFEPRDRALPRGVPVNVLLFPMEGDPMAAPAFWKLAIASGGSLVTSAGTGREAGSRAGRRRSIEVFSLSFLDCICCGFGAIILLLVLSKIDEPAPSSRPARTSSRDCEARTGAVRDPRRDDDPESRPGGDSRTDLRVHREPRTPAGRTRDRAGPIPAVRGAHGETWRTRASWRSRRQRLTEEMLRLQPYYRAAPDEASGGHTRRQRVHHFRRRHLWLDAAIQLGPCDAEARGDADVYPEVKGIQVMNDNGNYMFQQYAGKWIPDTPGRREAIINTMRTWRPFSDSNPADGIIYAINAFWSADRKISVYVFGDDFTGNSVETVLQQVEQVNLVAGTGERLVRIHAVGFPLFEAGGGGGVPPSVQRFAQLMRVLCDRNGGTFVALNGKD